VRIRQLPTDLEMTGATKAMVVDATGVVGWRTFPTGGGTDCRWALNNVNNLITATTSAGLCVGQDKFVGIGIAGPVAKLHVNHVPIATGSHTTVVAELVATGSSADDNYALIASVIGSGRNVRAVRGRQVIGDRGQPLPLVKVVADVPHVPFAFNHTIGRDHACAESGAQWVF
jgi:hypothetical protein